MIFLQDIVEKTSKVFDTLDETYSNTIVAQRAKDALTRYLLANDCFHVDAYMSAEWGRQHSEFLSGFFNFYRGNDGICDYLYCRMISGENLNEGPSQYHPLVCLVFASSLLLEDTATLAQLRFNSSSYSFMLAINDGVDEVNLVRLKYNYAGKMVVMPMAAVTRELFLSTIEKVFGKDKMRDMQTLYVLRSIRPHFQEIYRHINSDKEKIEKLAATRDDLREKKDRSNNESDFVEVANRMKTDIQKAFRESDRGLRAKYTDLSLPNTGEFSQITERLCAQLTTLDKRDGNDRFPKVVTSVPADFIAFLERNLRNTLSKRLGEDKQLIEKRINELVRNYSMMHHPELTKILQGIPQLYSSFPDHNRTVTAFVNASVPRNYSGELPKMTIQTALMHVRQQTMFIFIILSMISPIIGGIGMMVHNEGAGKYLYPMFGLVGAGFTVYYFINLKKKMPVMEEELFSKELEKVKTAIRQESTSNLSGATRDWLMNVNNWLNDVMERIGNNIDKAVTDFHKNRSTQNVTNEKSYQAALAEYNTRNQKFVNAERLASTILMDHNSVINQLELKVNTFSKQ